MAICTICKIEKPSEAFRANKASKSGVRSECIDCETELKRIRPPRNMVEKLINVPAIAQSNPLAGWTGEERLTRAIELRMEFYRCTALDAMYDLAMMPLGENSSLMQVKFMAASRLIGPAPDGVGGAPAGDFDSVLASLNEKYHKTAPRIKSVRERVVTFEDQPPALSVDG
jgi:hypothetical protein